MPFRSSSYKIVLLVPSESDHNSEMGLTPLRLIDQPFSLVPDARFVSK